MIVSKNEVTGNCQLTVDSFDLELVKKAIWDEQLLYYKLIKDRGHYDSVAPETVEEWKEKLRHLMNMADEIQRGSGTCCNTVRDLAVKFGV